MPDTSYISFFKLCYKFIIDVINFFRGRKQEEVDKVNVDLQNDYNKIDQDKEDGKQNNTQDRLNNLFK